MRIIKDFLKLFYPEVCLNCKDHLLFSEKIICASCRHDIPIIEVSDYQKNEIKAIFYGRVPIHMAASFLYYEKEGITKNLIHHLKYSGHQNVGSFIGNWFGNFLNEANDFKKIDFIVPVPLHRSKFKKRGYNQLTTFGKTLSKILNTTYQPNILERISATETQTHRKRFDRFSNINTKFNIKDLDVFTNKHILLIDDVITTGATIEACCIELQKTKNITVSVISMAFTQKTTN